MLTHQTTLVTPQLASAWLCSNVSNRKVSRQNLSFIKRQMASGEWKLNGEAISFTKSGALADGQHRLMACVEVDKPFMSVVVRGLDEDAFLTINTGKARSASDVFSIRAEKNSARLAGGIRTAVLLEAGEFQRNRKVSNAEAAAYLDANPLIREFANAGKNTVKLVGSGVFCGVRYLTWKSHPSKSAEFFEQLETGVGLEDRSAVKVFRERMIDQLSSRAKLSQADGVALAIKAWNLHLIGKKVGLIKYLTGKEEFPTIK